MSKNFEHFITYYFGLNFAFYAVFLEILSGMATSVDPDQTASLGLHCLHVILSVTGIQNFRTFII